MVELFSGIVSNILKGSEAPSLNQRITTEITNLLNNQNLSSSNFTSSAANLLNIKFPELQQFLPDGVRLQLQNNLSQAQPQSLKLNITQAEIQGGKLNLSGVATFTDANNQQRTVNFNGDGFVKLQPNAQQNILTTPQSQQLSSQTIVNPIVFADAFTIEQNPDIPVNIRSFVADAKIQLLQFSNITQPNPANQQAQLAILTSNPLNLKLVDVLLPNNQKVQITENPLNQSRVLVGQLLTTPNSNQALITTSVGNFRLDNALNLPNGTQISFLIDDAAPNITNVAGNILGAISAGSTQPLANYSNILSSDNSVFSNIFKILYGSGAPASTLVSQLGANPTERFSALKALWFMSASQTGNADKWASSEVVNSLKSNTSTNLEYGKDMEEVFSFLKTFTPGNVGEARQNQQFYSYLMPFYDGSTLSFATLNIDRKAYQNPNSDSDDAQKRFWVEFEEQEHGKVEIEGKYITQNNKLTSLDINVRSDRMFNEDFQNELNNLFLELSQHLEFAGILSFYLHSQTGQNTPITGSLGEGIVI
ncbi:MAG TPA: hypothetical protein DIV86_05440 [Alphaproteobacteria bacterium]|nr:hypothetical protein [Alphaproteobacteria bacterium]